MEITITESTSRQIRIPWIPEKISYKSGGAKFQTYDILNKGEIMIPKGENISQISWDGMFPGKGRSDHPLMHGTWQDPKKYLSLLKSWKKQGTRLRLIVTGTPFNLEVYLNDYDGAYTGGYSDFEYSISFCEYKEIKITATKKKTTTKRTAAPNKSQGGTSYKAYTVKTGDCLWDIATRFLGSGLREKEIYNLNKTIIERTAKQHGYASSEKGWWIFPGTKLKIPPS